MVNLKHAVQSQGFTVAHIKTDSIKIPDATPEIIKFVTEYGKLYGYNFEHEATYDRMCLVNDAVYIARYATVEKCCDLYGKSTSILQRIFARRTRSIRMRGRQPVHSSRSLMFSRRSSARRTSSSRICARRNL